MAEKKKLPNITLEDVTIKFRNFSGLEGKFNAAGRRNFCAFLPDDTAKLMENDGWNVKYLKPLEEDDNPQPYIKVNVRFDNYPPRIVMITSRGKTNLDESMVNILDWVNVVHSDMIINPSWYDVNGKTGYSAYAKTLYATIEEDYLEKKYIDVPDSAANSIPAQYDFDPNEDER